MTGRLIFGFLAGPLAWIIDQQISYALVQPSWRANQKLWLFIGTALGVVMLAAGFVATWSASKRARADGGEHHEHIRFFVAGDFALCAFFLLLLAAQLVPKIVNQLSD